MAQVKVFYEPEMELLTVFWQSPRKEQMSTELGVGVEILSYHPGDDREGAGRIVRGFGVFEDGYGLRRLTGV